MTKREIALKIAWSFLGTPYIWAGDDPMRGFDCSGMVIEILKSVGILPRQGDWTAEDLWFKFSAKDVTEHEADKGCLVFWHSSAGKIIHVEMLVTPELSIGASGGGSRTLSVADAIEANAYIKVRPWKSRDNVAGFIDPFMWV